jgi:hypothetical protein
MCPRLGSVLAALDVVVVVLVVADLGLALLRLALLLSLLLVTLLARLLRRALLLPRLSLSRALLAADVAVCGVIARLVLRHVGLLADALARAPCCVPRSFTVSTTAKHGNAAKSMPALLLGKSGPKTLRLVMSLAAARSLCDIAQHIEKD